MIKRVSVDSAAIFATAFSISAALSTKLIPLQPVPSTGLKTTGYFSSLSKACLMLAALLIMFSVNNFGAMNPFFCRLS
jgi:hypothetical protein